MTPTIHKKNPSVMIIAGDPSGDQHAAPIINGLRTQFPDIDTWGIGGQAMEKQGFKSLLPFAPFNRMGFLEVALHIRFFLNAKKLLAEQMKEKRPDVLVCVDYPGFNMPMMKIAHELDIPVVWYIAPMVWAWKKKRAKTLGEHASHIAVILPFEVDYFKGYKAKVSYVGNPLIESMNELSRSRASRNYTQAIDQGRPAIDLIKTDGQDPVLAIIPGSRVQELKSLLTPMIETFRLLKKKYPKLKALVSKCSYLSDDIYASVKNEPGMELFEGSLCDMLSRSDIALVKSGTATLETALMGIPMVIVYKTSLLTYTIAKSVLKIPYIGLPNIIASKKLIPECIQKDVNPETMAGELSRYLESSEHYSTACSNLDQFRSCLGEKCPSREVAWIVESLIR